MAGWGYVSQDKSGIYSLLTFASQRQGSNYFLITFIIFLKTINTEWLRKIIGSVVAEDLQKLKVKRMSNQKCKAAHENTEHIPITKHSQTLCAGGVKGNEKLFLNHILR